MFTAHLFLLMFFKWFLLNLSFHLQCSRATLPIFVPRIAGLLYVNDSSCSNLQYGRLFSCYFKIVMTLHTVCCLRRWRLISEKRHLLLTVLSAKRKLTISQQPPQTYCIQYWRNNFLYIHAEITLWMPKMT